MRELSKEELRIGNLITDQFGEVCTVDAVDENHVFNTEIGDIPIECCMPIPISEEWLLKLGFRPMDSDGYEYTQYKNKDWRFYVFKSDNYDGYLLVDGMVTITDRVKHVHQLQNLYFALSGEELTPKEDWL